MSEAKLPGSHETSIAATNIPRYRTAQEHRDLCNYCRAIRRVIATHRNQPCTLRDVEYEYQKIQREEARHP